MRYNSKRYQKFRINPRDRLLTPDQKLDYVPAIDYGLSNEPFVQPVVECGMYVHPKFPLLGASPDGLIRDKTVLEIKCPSSIIDKDKLPPYLYLNETTRLYQLEWKHPYFYQVQGEILCTDRKYGVLAVYHKNKHQSNKIYMSVIEGDQQFIERMEEWLVDFYNNYYKPCLVCIDLGLLTL